MKTGLKPEIVVIALFLLPEFIEIQTNPFESVFKLSFFVKRHQTRV